MSKWDGLERMGVSKKELIRMMQESICNHRGEVLGSNEWCKGVKCSECIYHPDNQEDFIEWVGEGEERSVGSLIREIEELGRILDAKGK